MKKQNTSGRPSPPVATPKLWYTATRCSPIRGRWIDAMHESQWSHCPMCGVCQRRCITPSPHWVSRSPSIHITLRHFLMRPKDRIAKGELTGVVYQVPCAGCPATYVRQMNKRLNQQLSEHRWAVESGGAVTSALAEHAWGAHHPVDWDKVRVLDHQPHHHQRLILESIHIRSD